MFCAEIIENLFFLLTESLTNLFKSAWPRLFELFHVLFERRGDVAAVRSVVVRHDLSRFFESEFVREIADEFHQHSVSGSFAEDWMLLDNIFDQSVCAERVSICT